MSDTLSALTNVVFIAWQGGGCCRKEERERERERDGKGGCSIFAGIKHIIIGIPR